MADPTILLGAVAYDPKVVTIWEGIREHFVEQGVPLDFALFSNFPKAVPDHYIRFLHNGFREAWTFMGTPIRIRVRSSRDSR